VFPALAFAIVAAPALVPLLLGPGWSDVTVICQILCVEALFKALGGAAVPAYLAKGRADLGFAWNLVIAIANGIVFFLAAGHGLIALTLSFAAVSMVQFVVLQTITGRIIGLKWNEYLGTIANDTAKSLVTGAVACVALTIGISSWEPVTLLSTVSLSSGALFLAIELSFSRDYLLELWHLFFPARNSRRARQE
jgi:O-antigen/teichoic acid export membrane protein